MIGFQAHVRNVRNVIFGYFYIVSLSSYTCSLLGTNLVDACTLGFHLFRSTGEIVAAMHSGYVYQIISNYHVTRSTVSRVCMLMIHVQFLLIYHRYLR